MAHARRLLLFVLAEVLLRETFCSVPVHVPEGKYDEGEFEDEKHEYGNRANAY